MSSKEWVVAMYCDYGKENNKRVIRLSYSPESAQNSWKRMSKGFSKNGYRCWQEVRERHKPLLDHADRLPKAQGQV